MSSQAYQNVTARVVTNPIRGASNTGMKNNGRCQPATSTAMIAVAASRDRSFCSSGWANPRKLGSSINAPPNGLTMCRPMASGRPYHGVSRLSDGAEAPSATLSETEAKWTNRGTPMASAYQTQLTRQRISREPTTSRPRGPSVIRTTTMAAISAPGAKKLFHGMAPQARK